MTASYQKFGGACGILTGIAGLLYLVLFVLLKDPAALAPALCLLAVGVFALATLVALYQRVSEVEAGFALWGLLLGFGGASCAAARARIWYHPTGLVSVDRLAVVPGGNACLCQETWDKEKLLRLEKSSKPC